MFEEVFPYRTFHKIVGTCHRADVRVAGRRYVAPERLGNPDSRKVFSERFVSFRSLHRLRSVVREHEFVIVFPKILHHPHGSRNVPF
jgi:hypothetical protein